MAEIKAGNRSPVTLTKKGLGTSEGQALLELLERTLSDGRLTDQEVKLLEAWLATNVSNTTLPGIHFLREEVEGILADGAVSDGEVILLQKAILRVLPITERERAKAKIADADAAASDARFAEANKATDKQIKYIRDLGGSCPVDATKIGASEIIEKLLDSRPTLRQQMVLRFWNRTDLLKAGVEGVSNWMDQWYEEDPARGLAWELWKRDAGDYGGRSPNEVPTVPLGAGFDYLKKVKNGVKIGLSKPGQKKSGGCLNQISVMCVILFILIIALQ
ncbi:MAG: hypothetical protein M0R70_14730 [Nitrospirae bacterium]|nr:hypothetical protein [Nitrospirota bacterium]